ncbi:hypothetical protein G2W53_017600 [Senna tora]|uniref:Uncharacterized protein n=1 Tax=Senna tora TaxID=362788 RepID=A0A834TT33_9FABA|nr:hypothetical protein G2W53_017600 [Senna tora]
MVCFLHILALILQRIDRSLSFIFLVLLLYNFSCCVVVFSFFDAGHRLLFCEGSTIASIARVFCFLQLFFAFSIMTQASTDSRIAPRRGPQRWLALGRDVGPSHEGTSSKDHESRVADSDATPFEEKYISSPFYLPIDEDLPLLVEGGCPRLICRVPKRCMKVLASYPGSRFNGIAGDSDGSLRVMSTDEVGFLMYTFVMERLSVKPLLNTFEMAMLSCVNLCPTQLTSNSWIVLAYFQLHCHNLGVLPRVKLFSFFYQLGRSFSGQPWHFAKVNKAPTIFDKLETKQVPEVMEARMSGAQQAISGPLTDEEDEFATPLPYLYRLDDSASSLAGNFLTMPLKSVPPPSKATKTLRQAFKRGIATFHSFMEKVIRPADSVRLSSPIDRIGV